MPIGAPIPRPVPGQLLLWSSQYPEAPGDAIDDLNKLTAMQVKLVRAGTATLGRQSLQEGQQGMLLELPVFYPSGVPQPLGTGATLAQVISKINELLAAEKAVQGP